MPQNQDIFLATIAGLDDHTRSQGSLFVAKDDEKLGEDSAIE
jgi:hypothetical protein